MLKQHLQQVLNLFLLDILNRVVLGIGNDRLNSIRVNSILTGNQGLNHVVKNVAELYVVNLTQHQRVVAWTRLWMLG
jgi:hypothetical protein